MVSARSFRHVTTRVVQACAVMAVALCVMLTNARAALAVEYPDILLAAFFNSELDQSDTLYTSIDGVNFTKIGVAYQDSTPNDGSNAWVTTDPYNVATLHDPSIIYHNGWFYMLSGFTDHAKYPGRYIPMIGYSKDLVNWAYPNSGSTTNVALSQFPPTSNASTFDAVAPEFFQTSSGEVYITFSAGYYGAWHGQPQADQMYPYLVKLDHLGPGTNDPASNPGAWPDLSYGTAVPINLPEASLNRIDGSFYEENGTYYYIIKENGVTNEIWSIKDLSRVSDASAWTKVNGNALTGFEGPSLVKFHNEYLLYTDKLADFPFGASDGTTGTFVQRSTSLASGWTGNTRISTKTASGVDIPNRHGTVMVVTDPAAKELVWKLTFAADPNAQLFPDAPKNDWSYGPIRWALETGLMGGYGDGSGRFGPFENMTRSQMAATLYNNAGKPSADLSLLDSYTDVPSGQWFSAPIAWATENGIMGGDGAGYFQPSGFATREQLVTVLWRISGEPESSYDLSQHPDGLRTSEFARKAMAWAAETGVVNGNAQTGELLPTGTLTRAAAAGLIMNWSTKA